MDPGLLTKAEVEVYRLVKDKLSQLRVAGSGDGDGGEEAAAAVESAAARLAMRRMIASTSAPPGTATGPSSHTRLMSKTSRARRSQTHPDETNLARFSIMKHVEEKDGKDGHAGALVLDSKETTHSLKRHPYSLLESANVGPGTTELVVDGKVPNKMKRAPPCQWYIYFEMDNLHAELAGANQSTVLLARARSARSIHLKRGVDKETSGTG